MACLTTHFTGLITLPDLFLTLLGAHVIVNGKSYISLECLTRIRGRGEHCITFRSGFVDSKWPWKHKHTHIYIYPYIDGLVQERCKCIYNALELHFSFTNTSTYLHQYHFIPISKFIFYEITVNTLTHCGLMKSHDDRDLGQHWVR